MLDTIFLRNQRNERKNRVKMDCLAPYGANNAERQKSGNNPTLLKTPDFKGFYSSRFAIDSIMTAKNQDALLFTAEHLLVLGTDLIIQSAEK